MTDEKARVQIEGYVGKLLNNQMQISIKKSNDKLIEEMRPLLPEDAIVETKDNEAEEAVNSEESTAILCNSPLYLALFGGLF